MPVFVSPGVYTRELDFSLFVQALSTAVPGMVITARTGPLDEVVLITNVNQAIQTFGNPIAAPVATYGMYSLLQFLRRGNQAFVVRVAGSDKDQPTINVTGDAYPGCGTTDFGPFTFADATAATYTGDEYDTFNLYDETRALFTGGDASANLAALQAVADGSLTVTWSGGGPTNIPTIDIANYDGPADPADDFAEVAAAIQLELDATLGAGIISVMWNGTAFVFTDNDPAAYGAASSVTITAGTTGTDLSPGGLAALLTGAGAAAGADGNNRILVAVNTNGAPEAGGGGSPYTFELTTGAAVTIATVVADITGNTAGITPSIETVSGAGDALKITHNTATADSDFEFQAIAGSAYTTIGLDAIEAVVQSGTDSDNTLDITVTNTAVVDPGAPRTVTFAFGVLTVDEVVTAIDAIIGPSGADVGIVFKVVEPGGEKVRICSKDEGPTSTIAFAGSALTPLGLGAGPFAGGSAAATNTLAFTERYYGNRDISVVISNGTDFALGSNEVFKVDVYEGTTLVSSYDNLRKTAGSLAEEEELFEAVIGTDANPIDSYITVEDLGGSANPELGTYVLATASSDPSGLVLSALGSEVVGTPSPATGLQLFRSVETVDINVLAAPAQSQDGVLAELIDIAETRADIISLLDPPFGLSVQQVADWHNGIAPYDGHAAFNSSYAATYYPWVQVLDSVNGQNVWTPPSGHIMAVYAYNDSVADAWFAPAGLQRGRIPAALALELNLNTGERDFLLGNRNRVNTIVNFVNEGIAVFSQKTLMRSPSALNDISVRRMLLYAEKTISIATRALCFEPNDGIMWAEFELLVNPHLTAIANRRGLVDFRVVMNEATVTSDLSENNEARGVLFLKPTKAAEKILIDFVLTSQGASFSELEELLF